MVLGLPQGPIKPEMNPVRLFGPNTSPPTSAGLLLATEPVYCRPSIHVQESLTENAASTSDASITGSGRRIAWYLFPANMSNLLFSLIFRSFNQPYKCVILCHKISMASPKLKKRYLSRTAAAYASSTCSLPASADTSITSVDSGR